MSAPAFEPPYDQLLATAERVIRERPEADPEITREIFEEAATLLYNGLALDGLDEHDAHAAVAALCEDLVDPDPGAAVRRRATVVAEEPGDLHDPDSVGRALLIAASIFKL